MAFNIETINSTILDGFLNETQQKTVSIWLSNKPPDDERMSFLVVANFIKKHNMNEKKYMLCLSKTFNSKFIDEYDATKFKHFHSNFTDLYKNNYNENKSLRHYARIAIDNFKYFDKKYLTDLVLEVTNYCSNLPNGYQAPRDIIDLCKYALKVTGYMEFHYVLAESIYHMCPCCYQPKNYKEVCIKHYEKALDAGICNIEIYQNLVEIYADTIDETKSNKYYEKCKDCLNKVLKSTHSSSDWMVDLG